MDNENGIGIFNKKLPKFSFLSLMLQFIWIVYFFISIILLSYKGYPNGTFLSKFVIKAITSNLFIVVLPILLKIYYLSTLEMIKEEEGKNLEIFVKSLRSNFKKEKDVFKFFVEIAIGGILLIGLAIALKRV